MTAVSRSTLCCAVCVCVCVKGCHSFMKSFHFVVIAVILSAALLHLFSLVPCWAVSSHNLSVLIHSHISRQKLQKSRVHLLSRQTQQDSYNGVRWWRRVHTTVTHIMETISIIRVSEWDLWRNVSWKRNVTCTIKQRDRRLCIAHSEKTLLSERKKPEDTASKEKIR